MLSMSVKVLIQNERIFQIKKLSKLKMPVLWYFYNKQHRSLDLSMEGCKIVTLLTSNSLRLLFRLGAEVGCHSTSILYHSFVV